ncbi:hypothetical protein Goshw_000905 [Gossypium schwendimanii]|uniref:Uncharacterized protein n=1 Tax=Gossypium schwendimanii TaxID=34291 RepID=A0A7J9MEY9_GOSSC|nr:hypothetical protein [Gossypium schwendimanii]
MPRWTSIGRPQDGKTLKRLHNSTGRTESSIDTTLGSTDTTRTSIDRTHFSVQGSFGLRSVPIPWFDLLVLPIPVETLKFPPMQKDLYRYNGPNGHILEGLLSIQVPFYRHNEATDYI